MSITFVRRFDDTVETIIAAIEAENILDIQENFHFEDYPDDDIPVWELDPKPHRNGRYRLRRVN